ncbi:imidazole glycerol phosphate synthase subunit HisH [uncultured Legionella sp.]|uniref:imidazole glycerol phosphate synthase subunit HisH n=1 Tax=uncultured Legionella sp. TaxID=210934 RepID=UPI002631C48D|nr:imidazole glycerol phosphate synthase subunit HisH [uncultured Legionella sp.]
MIKIIDYGLGNISAFINVYKRLNIAVSVAQCAQDLNGTTKLILPGVGAFDHAMQRLNDSGMREIMTQLVQEQHVPVLGICVGMQILANSSDEGMMPGLGFINGTVKKMDELSSSSKFALPHMGWNDVNPVGGNLLFSGLEQDARFYFLHSYYFECEHNEHILAEVEYGKKFTCAVNQHNIYGVQFHPEKSHHYGARLLNNFAEL